MHWGNWPGELYAPLSLWYLIVWMQQLFNNFYNKILHGYKSSYIDFTHQSYVAIWVNKSSPHQRCAKYILNTKCIRLWKYTFCIIMHGHTIVSQHFCSLFQKIYI